MNQLEIPPYERHDFHPRRTKYLLCIPVINEGLRLRTQLEQIQHGARLADVVIADGGSSDGSTEPGLLQTLGVRTLLKVQTDGGGVSRQLQAAFAFGLAEGYDGIITIDGNNKDDASELPLFVEQLDRGVDLVQGSRFAPGGRAINTPASRLLGITLIHAPLLSLAGGFRYRDTTNGFRGYSRALLEHPAVQPFRSVIRGYEMLWYLNVRAPQVGLRVVEVPVSRRYPARGRVPTKISPIAGKLKILGEILRVVSGTLNPPRPPSPATQATHRRAE